MNSWWRKTQSHKSNNTAGKHSQRLRFSSGLVMVIIIILILGAMAWL
uniref:Uncharacterized protein n=3 Tax=Viruses TaxID=10239 RepID=A0AAU8GJG1_9CAUD